MPDIEMKQGKRLNMKSKYICIKTRIKDKD